MEDKVTIFCSWNFQIMHQSRRVKILEVVDLFLFKSSTKLKYVQPFKIIPSSHFVNLKRNSSVQISQRPFIAIQYVLPGFAINLFKILMPCPKSGLVQTIKYIIETVIFV